MKDLVIPATRIHRELWTLAICFAVSLIINIVSIIWFHTPFYEVFTQIGYTVVISVALYVIWTGIRIMIWLVSKAFHKA